MRSLIRKNLMEVKPYQAGKPIKEVERELGIDNIIKMASNENPLGPSPQAVEAMRNCLEEVNLYPDSSGYYLKRSLSGHLGLDPSNIILGNGSNEIIELIAETFLNGGEEVVISDNAFIIFQMVVKVMGGRPVIVNMKNLTHDLKAMADAVKERTKLVFIANPNNPTGTMVTKDEISRFMDKIPRGVVVIFDEAYYEYVESDDFPQTVEYVKEGRNVVILRTFSKMYGLAGLRIGYGLARAELIDGMEKVRQPFNTSSLAQIAATAALQDREHLAGTRRNNREGKAYICGELDRLNISYVPSQTNFVLIDTGGDGEKVFKKLLKKGIIVRSMVVYGLPRFIRVTIGTEEQNRRFISAFKEIL